MLAEPGAGAVGLFKTATVTEVSPGDLFSYNFVASCSGLQLSCLDAVLTDPIPLGLELINVPPSTDQYDVAVTGTFPAQQTLVVSFKIPLVAPNPPGSVGLPDGSALNLVLGVRLPAESQVQDGSTITNTGEITATGSDPVTSTADVDVDVPKVVTPVATKTWTDGAAVAGTDEASTIRLGVRNASSSSAEITELQVEDTSQEVFDKFDVTGLGAITFPAGADQVIVLACDEPASACTTDADFTPSTPQTGVPLVLPLPAADITGLRFVFSNSAGLTLPYDPTGGSVEVEAVLRDTLRSGGPYNPTVTDAVTNCAVPGAIEAELGASTDTQACVDYTVYPAQATIAVTKSFFSDANGDFGPDGRAVVNQSSPVSAVTTNRNTSPFPLSQMVITEPSATSPSELAKLDATSVRAVFPTGATTADVAIDCGTGPVVTTITATGNVPVPCPDVTSISITYSGVDGSGNGTIAEGAAASLGVHGTLNATADASDVNRPVGRPGVTGDGVANCADGAGSSSINGVGSAAGTGCATLDLFLDYFDVQGVKSAQLPTILPGLPRLFTLSFTNGGTIPALNVVMADPVDPRVTPNAFVSTRLADLTLPASPPATAEVFDPDVDGYVAYDAGDAALLARATGFRVVVPSLAPGATYTLQFNVLLRDGVPAATMFANCAGITASGQTSNPFCSQDITVTSPSSSASLQKVIQPNASVRPQDGLPGTATQVRLTVQNTGTNFLKQLVATDADAAFFDAVDLVGPPQVNFPPGSDRVRVDVCTGACGDADWVLGTVTGSRTPPLPAGVTAADARGVRAVFTAVPVSTPTFPAGDAYRIRPGPPLTTGVCANASVCIPVRPRIDLRSAPGTPVPDTLTDSASGGYESRTQTPDTLAPIPEVPATLTLTDGTAQLQFSKSPNATVVPGASIPFVLRTSNTGTGAIAEPTVVEPVPAELEYAPLDIAAPYEITYTLPAGTPNPPDVVFTQTNDPTTGKTTGLRWEFPGWDLVPGAVVRIQVRMVLAPGARAGQAITNTAGASGGRPDLTCNLNGVPEGEQAVDDPVYGPGRFCLSSAELETGEGNAFRTQKWVAGDPDLGFLNTATGTVVALDDPACPHLDLGGRLFTRYPCVARVLPGQGFDFYLQLTNSGTNPATEVRVVDVFPHPGDTGVILTGSARGTEWNEAPTLLSAVTLAGKGTADIGYTAAAAPVCTTDLNAPPQACDPGAFPSAAPGPGSTAFRALITFDPTDRLQPGETTGLRFSMAAPADPSDATDDVAWNSFAHTEFFQSGQLTAQLPPTEPIKVGVAIVYGGLTITKTVDDPSGASDSLQFAIDYECTISPIGGGAPVTVASGTVTIVGGDSAAVPGVPAGATCAIWEPDAQGLVSNAPSRAEALTVRIPIDGGAGIATVDVVNTAPVVQPPTTTTTTTTTVVPPTLGPTSTSTSTTTTTTVDPGTTTTTTGTGVGAGGGTGSGGGSLPATGTDSGRFVAIAMVLLGLGLVSMGAVRRRPSRP